MSVPRVIPLFDPDAAPPSWNERMQKGEYAVLFANRQPESIPLSLGPAATIFASLGDAERYACAETALNSHLRCSVYDHHGMANTPVRVIAGVRSGDGSSLSSGFRLWVGGACLLVGMVLGLVDWWSDFRLTWPGLLAARIGPAGAVLLLMEAGVLLTARWKKTHP